MSTRDAEELPLAIVRELRFVSLKNIAPFVPLFVVTFPNSLLSKCTEFMIVVRGAYISDFLIAISEIVP